MRNFVNAVQGRKDGMLLEWDPETKQTTCLVDGLWFANGVATPRDGAFVLVVQSHRFSISKYWLEGEKVRTSAVTRPI